MFTKCQLLIIANIFLCFPHGIKINDFWEWGGDTSNSDNRAFYKFLQRKHRQIRSNLFLWRRNMAILWTCFFLLSKDFPFYIKYACSLRKKNTPSSFMVAFKCVFSKRYFLLCLHSSISWNKYETAYELAFLVQVFGPKSGSFWVAGRIFMEILNVCKWPT